MLGEDERFLRFGDLSFLDRFIEALDETLLHVRLFLGAMLIEDAFHVALIEIEFGDESLDE